MSSEYIFSLALKVNDVTALQRAALRSYTADNDHSEASYAEAENLFGVDSEPNIPACIVQLLDPGQLPGCSVIDSSVG